MLLGHASLISSNLPLDVLLKVVDQTSELLLVVDDVLSRYVEGNYAVLDLNVISNFLVTYDIVRQNFNDLCIGS